jgi:hypothetical protein
MFRLIRRLGCLVMLAVLAVAGWMTRDLWMSRVTGRAPAPEPKWESAAAAEAGSATRRVTRLGEKSGPAYATLSGGEAVALILDETARRYPARLFDVRGAVEDNQLYLRATVDLRDARGLDRLGAVADLLSSRRAITLSGTPAVSTPGRGVFEVTGVQIDGIHLPAPAIALLVDQLLRAPEAGAAEEAGTTITFPLPPHIGDIRVSNGAVTVYKRVP